MLLLKNFVAKKIPTVPTFSWYNIWQYDEVASSLSVGTSFRSRTLSRKQNGKNITLCYKRFLVHHNQILAFHIYSINIILLKRAATNLLPQAVYWTYFWYSNTNVIKGYHTFHKTNFRAFSWHHGYFYNPWMQLC